MTLAVRRWSVAVVACLAVTAAAVAAPVPGSPDKKGAESPAEKILKALDQTADFNLENSNLQAALTTIGEQGKFNVVIDRFWLINNLGIDPTNGAPINLKLTGVKTKTALRSVVGQYNLGYAIVGDTILVTSEELAIQKQLKQRVNVDLDKVPAADAFNKLGKETGTNLLIDSRVAKEAQTAVTLQVEDVPLDTAVKLVSQMAGLKTVRIGNVLFITNKATADEMRQDPDLHGGGPGGQASEQMLLERELLQFKQQLAIPQQLLINPPPKP
jgi:hypothetical protein